MDLWGRGNKNADSDEKERSREDNEQPTGREKVGKEWGEGRNKKMVEALTWGKYCPFQSGNLLIGRGCGVWVQFLVPFLAAGQMQKAYPPQLNRLSASDPSDLKIRSSLGGALGGIIVVASCRRW